MDIDFGFGAGNNGDSAGSANENKDGQDVTNLDNNQKINDANGEPAANLDNNDGGDKPNDRNVNNDNTNPENDDKKNDNGDTDLQPGTSIEVGDETYTVDDNGNILDKDGNIFKEAKDVKAWLDSFENVSESDNDITLSTIQDAIGVSITDENDKPIEFENTPEGVNAYVNAVIETAREEHYETAINTLYERYPILHDVLNYYIANGNSLDGFGEVADRSGITIDDSNEAQQESIIRTAWKEQNRKGDVESYIQYLKSSGILLATAREELAGLQEADKEYRENLSKEAEKKENERIASLEKYWNGVHDVVKARNIAGYQIPENIIITRNGQKITVTPEDFFNYIYRVDEKGQSAYQKDLLAETAESRRDDEILRAYLKFVGGNYSNLVDMAINKQNVNTLKLKAKQRNTTSVRINKPQNAPKTGASVDLGYE